MKIERRKFLTQTLAFVAAGVAAKYGFIAYCQSRSNSAVPHLLSLLHLLLSALMGLVFALRSLKLLFGKV